MIHSFRFKNFCSFAEEAMINFEDTRKGLSTENNMFCNSPAGSRLSKVTILAGPNASGKTSALKALSFLGWFVRYSFVSIEGDQEIPVDMFNFPYDEKSVSEFELVFEHNNELYKYSIHLNKRHVINEELFKKDKKTKRFNYLFTRFWNPSTQMSEINQRINLRPQVIKEILRKNVSLIAASVALNNEILTEIASFFQGIISNVNRMGKAWDTSSSSDQGLLYQAADICRRKEDLFRQATLFLSGIDLGLNTIEIQEADAINQESGEMIKIYRAVGIHKVDGKKYHLPFLFESSGTKNMFILLVLFLLPALSQGGIAVIDELEIDLHPHMLPNIIALFSNPATNPNNTQLLFTSHSLEILNHLEKEQVILVEKDENCKSELYRLDELKGIRRDDNIYAKYMTGAYGAVPNI